jgi:plastocyanin
VSWLAILLSLASLGGSAGPSKAPVRKHCTKAAAAKHQCKPPKPKSKPKTPAKPIAKVKPREDGQPTTPGAQNDAPRSSEPRSTSTPTPTPSATPAPSATATPDPVKYPTRTSVDLTEWEVRSSYGTLAAGRVVFNANNLGEDDHNLSVRSGSHEYGRYELAPGDSGSLVLQLAPGTYTLYCSLTGHEDQGMRTDISVR